MRDKVQTSLWLDLDVKQMVDNEGLNLSKWVNESLRAYFSLSSVEEIDRKIEKVERELKILQSKRKDLMEQGMAETREEALRDEAWDKLKELYRIRREQGIDEALDESWIRGKQNIRRLAALRLTSEDALRRLREWYFEEFGKVEE